MPAKTKREVTTFAFLKAVSLFAIDSEFGDVDISVLRSFSAFFFFFLFSFTVSESRPSMYLLSSSDRQVEWFKYLELTLLKWAKQEKETGS